MKLQTETILNGLTAQEEGDFRAAIRLFEHAMKTDPRAAVALATLYLMLGKEYAYALILLEQALQSDVAVVEALKTKGLLLAELEASSWL